MRFVSRSALLSYFVYSVGNDQDGKHAPSEHSCSHAKWTAYDFSSGRMRKFLDVYNDDALQDAE